MERHPQGCGNSFNCPNADLFFSVFQFREVLSSEFRMVGENLLRPALPSAQKPNSPANPDADVRCHARIMAVCPRPLVSYGLH